MSNIWVHKAILNFQKVGFQSSLRLTKKKKNDKRHFYGIFLAQKAEESKTVQNTRTVRDARRLKSL